MKEFSKKLLKILSLMIVLNFFLWIYTGYGIMAGYSTGESMKPTISNKGVTIIINYPGLVDNLNRSDIVSWQNGKKQYTKRVIAFPGETIEINNGITYINGEEYKEDYVVYNEYKYTYYTLSENEYFLAGDNRANSNDSRYFGALSKEGFMGKVLISIPIPF